MKEPTQIVANIRLTEKASLLGERNNQYVFRVATDANKIEIKQAAQYAGKKKRERRADFGRKTHWKKAVVTLAEGEKIELA
jgi:large subunit ribosomal protein L23